MKFGSETRVYIAGCGGMLGAAVYQQLDDICVVRATDIDLNEPWLEMMDIRDRRETAADIGRFEPDVIINLAALTDLEVCERQPDNAWETNAYAAEALGEVASRRGIPYVFVSTAGIFDGGQDYYSEDDVPKPLSIYGQTKYHAELVIARQVAQHFIFRAGWMMGGGPSKDKKFINKIYQQLAAGARQLRVVDDKLGSPTYTHDFARGMLTVLEHGQPGLFNQCGAGQGSRYDVAVEFVKLLGLADTVCVLKVSSEEFQQEYFATRPRSERLINRRLDTLGLNVMRDWKVCLAEYCDEFRRDLQGRRSHYLTPVLAALHAIGSLPPG